MNQTEAAEGEFEMRGMRSSALMEMGTTSCCVVSGGDGLMFRETGETLLTPEGGGEEDMEHEGEGGQCDSDTLLLRQDEAAASEEEEEETAVAGE